MSFGRSLYKAATGFLGFNLPGILRSRVRKGKENPNRLNERHARNLPSRPDGTLIWLHGASVGESLVNLSVAEGLAAANADASFLFTSQTLTAADLLNKRIAQGPLNGRALHQMAPIDTPRTATRFAVHWRPNLAIFAEGEIWPNLIEAVSDTGCPLALINARMTSSSLQGWARFGSFARDVFDRFSLILASDTRTAVGLSAISGREIPMVGNLKASAPPPAADPDLLAALTSDLDGRKVWLAASTHRGEETLALSAHKAAGQDSLLIIAPRHPERGADVAAEAEAGGFKVSVRSYNEVPTRGTDVYVADTLGEIGLWARLACGVYLGGGHAPGLGGHNPVELVKLDRPVAAGPITFNFEAVFAELTELGAVTIVAGADELAHEVSRWLSGEVTPPDLTDWQAKLDAPLRTTLAALQDVLAGNGTGTDHA